MIVAVSMVKDEADIIGAIVSHLLAEGVDHLIVADNNSTDGTREILEQFGSLLKVVDDPEPGYYQAEKMTRLAHQAGTLGAHWVIPFDADELWYSPLGRLGDILPQVPADVLIATTYHHIPHPDDPDDPNPVRRMVHRMADPKPMSKVAFRYRFDAQLHMGNHDVNNVGGVREHNVLAIREFQYRSFEQMRRKVRNGLAAYAASDLDRHFGTHWRTLGAMSGDELLVEWNNHYGAEGLVYDPAPLRGSLPRIAS